MQEVALLSFRGYRTHTKVPPFQRTISFIHRTYHRMPSSIEEIVIDGSKGEGGGQILRNAISFANILRKPLNVHHIRAKRSKPGLKAQHVASLQLPTAICGGRLSNDRLHSTEIHFRPARSSDSIPNVERTLYGEIKTAGSICLLLQAALPCALFGSKAPCRLVLKGGTNADMAPQYDYWERVLLPTLRHQCGLSPEQIEPNVLRRGYFPKGGGEVHVHVTPLASPLRPIRMTERGEICEIYIRSFHAGQLPRHLAQEMATEAQSFLNKRLPPTVSFRAEVATERAAVGSGAGILVIAKTTTGNLLAGSALSTSKKRAGDIGIEAAQELWSTLQDGGCVDEWLQDQLILFMALASGTSEILTGSLTLHTRTAIWIAEEMSGAKFQVQRLSESGTTLSTKSDQYGQDGRIAGMHLIQCQGIGFRNETVS